MRRFMTILVAGAGIAVGLFMAGFFRAEATGSKLRAKLFGDKLLGEG